MTTDLFEGEVDLFVTAKERLGTWPITVWEVDHSDSLNQKFKKLIGDSGEARHGVLDERKDVGESVYGGRVSASIFNPSVCSWILNAYAPKEGACIDPFAGGGTRAILASKHGLFYTGTEIRSGEVEAVMQRCSNANVKAKIVCGDAREIHKYASMADFLLTCPPYWNLERYSGGEKDLSMLPTYSAFIEAMRAVVASTFKALKPGALSCWVVGLIRDDSGALIPMHHHIARLHLEAGFRMKEEVILWQKNNGAMQRVGQFSKGHGHLVRIHEYALVFERS